MNKFLVTAAVLIGLSGCATVPSATESETKSAKEFNIPTTDKSGIYVYRANSSFGGALKKDVWIDDECIGETAPGVFFYHEVAANKNHKISTESEFSANDLNLETKGGQLYFIEQYIKMGAFVGGAGLQQVDSEKGQAEVLKLKMAKKGHCNSTK
jgi:hypothetical protein